MHNRLRTAFCVRAFVECSLPSKRGISFSPLSGIRYQEISLENSARRWWTGEAHTVCDGKMKISASSGINPLGHLARCTIHFHFYAQRDESASERTTGWGGKTGGKTQIEVYRDEQEMNAESGEERKREREWEREGEKGRVRVWEPGGWKGKERKKEIGEQQRHSLAWSAARLINTNGMQIKSIVRSFEF